MSVLNAVKFARPCHSPYAQDRHDHNRTTQQRAKVLVEDVEAGDLPHLLNHKV